MQHVAFVQSHYINIVCSCNYCICDLISFIRCSSSTVAGLSEGWGDTAPPPPQLVSDSPQLASGSPQLASAGIDEGGNW